MTLRTGARNSVDDTGHERVAEHLFERESMVCYSLAVHLLDRLSVATEIVEQVLGDAVWSGPAARLRGRLLDEVHRLAVARTRDRPRSLDPPGAEARVRNSLNDPQVCAALTDMPALPRSALLLVYFAGYRLRELAETLDCTPDELRDALYTATTILARDLRTRRTH